MYISIVAFERKTRPLFIRDGASDGVGAQDFPKKASRTASSREMCSASASNCWLTLQRLYMPLTPFVRSLRRLLPAMQARGK